MLGPFRWPVHRFAAADGALLCDINLTRWQAGCLQCYSVGPPEIKGGFGAQRREAVTDAGPQRLQRRVFDFRAHFVATGPGRGTNHGGGLIGVHAGFSHVSQKGFGDARYGGAPGGVGEPPVSGAGDQNERTVGAAADHAEAGAGGPQGIGFAQVPGVLGAQHLATVHLLRPGGFLQSGRVNQPLH